MGKTGEKFLFWAPRVLSILFLIFLALFSLDVFTPGAGPVQIVIGFFVHNIPVFVLAAVLFISWKHEIVGAIAFILAGVLYITMIFMNMLNGPFEINMLTNSLIIAVPAFLIGALFLTGWYKKRKNRLSKDSG